jgi:RND family efflux transporter MFP subunit
MKSWSAWIILVVAIAAAGGMGYWLGHRSAASGKDEAEAGAETKVEPTATVTVAPLRRATISTDIIAYGTVVVPASEISVVSVPFESRVTKMLVAPGETVTAGQPLVEVEGSAATLLSVEEARNTQAAAERDLEAVKQRYEQKLATNADLYTAENNLRTAQGRLKSLQQGGAGGPAQLKAEAAGIVSKVDVQIGQVVPIGNPLVEVAAQNRIEVHLGVEPEDAELLKAGQAVKLQPIDDADAKPITGKVRLIGQRVDPATRLVDVLVSLPPNTAMLLESFVVGTITRTSAGAMMVPRSAALPNEEGGYELFTVKDGKAVKHVIHIGVENDQDVQVIGEDLKEGDAVVTTGNLELEDGMAVRAQEGAQPATTAPAGTQPTSPAVEGAS